jgi:hypothetical protein
MLGHLRGRRIASPEPLQDLGDKGVAHHLPTLSTPDDITSHQSGLLGAFRVVDPQSRANTGTRCDI